METSGRQVGDKWEARDQSKIEGETRERQAGDKCKILRCQERFKRQCKSRDKWDPKAQNPSSQRWTPFKRVRTVVIEDGALFVFLDGNI